jgi:hypothetical protein
MPIVGVKTISSGNTVTASSLTRSPSLRKSQRSQRVKPGSQNDDLRLRHAFSKARRDLRVRTNTEYIHLALAKPLQIQ